MLSRVRTVDVVLALCQFALGIITWLSVPSYARTLWLPLFALLYAGLVLLRRAAPAPSAAAIYALSLPQVALGIEPGPMNLVVLLSLYSVTAHGPTWANRVGLAGGGIGAFIFAVLVAGPTPTGPTPSNVLVYFLPTLFAVGVAWALGLARRSRITQQRADEARIAALEAAKSTDAELAVAAERSRIAREMHDVVAHSLAVIIAQADGGRYAAATNPEQATKSLETIAEIGRDALADIRRILGVLRTADADVAVVTPQPTADDLADVIARVKDTGANVAYTTMGTPRPLMPGMNVTLQRVCQEALTNALKHAGPGATMSVMLRYTDADVTLQVDDDGRGAAAFSDGAGSGLVGMRERAALFGGTLHAGPKATGGFRVKLTLPLSPDHAQETA